MRPSVTDPHADEDHALAAEESINRLGDSRLSKQLVFSPVAIYSLLEPLKVVPLGPFILCIAFTSVSDAWLWTTGRLINEVSKNHQLRPSSDPATWLLGTLYFMLLLELT